MQKNDTSIYTTTPQYITNVWAIQPIDIINKIYTSEQRSGVKNSMIPHFFYEFTNNKNVIIIDSCWVPKPTIYDCDPAIIRDYLVSIYTSEIIICFDNTEEGNIIPLASKVHEIIANTIIDPKQVHCFSSGLNTDIYQEWCDDNNIEESLRLNFYGVNAWEYYTKKKALDQF